MTMHAFMRRLLAAFCCVSTTACYSYIPVRAGDAFQPGSAVRVRVSASEAERLEELRSVYDRLVEGVVVGSSGSEVLLDTSVGTLDPMRGTRPLTQRLNIARSEINEVELRRLDRFRTGAAVGGLVLATGLVVAAAFGGIIGGPRDDVDPPVELWRGGR
jgi:hypothetical protein